MESPLKSQNFTHPPPHQEKCPLPHQRLIPTPTNNAFLCYNPIKTSFVGVVCPTVPYLTSDSLYTKAILILTLIDVQYLQNVVFSFERGSNSQILCSF